MLFKISLQGIVGYPLRSILAVISLVLGIVSVVTVYSAALTIEATVTQKAILSGGPSSTFDTNGFSGEEAYETTSIFASQLASYIGKDGEVTRIATASSVALESSGQVLDSNVSFLDSNIINIRHFPVIKGVWLQDEGDVRPTVVLNRALEDNLINSGSSSLNLVVRPSTNQVPVRVVGVIDDGNSHPALYGNIRDLPGITVNQGSTVDYSLEISGPLLTSDVLTKRLNELSSYSKDSLVWTVARRDTLGSLDAELSATRSTFVTIGVIALVTTVFAIANIGLSTLRERANELSLRRALGARRSHIPLIMTLEAQMIAFVAAALAIPFSLILYPFIAGHFGAPFGVSPPPFPWIAGVFGFLVGMLTALAGSFVPSIRSLKVPISSMMRD